MWPALDAGRIDLIVLDLMLPGDDGLTLCRNLRAKSSDMPVIMLTARGEETDRIVGLEMGADDYLAKPFSPRELLARIKAILRRARSLPENLQPDSARGSAVRRLGARHGRSATSSRRRAWSRRSSGAEYRLLRIFLSHPNRVLNRDQLIDLTQGKEADPLDRSIDVQVSRLRHRLGDDPREPRLIKTVRGEGYVLAVDGDGGAVMRLLPRSLFGRLVLVLRRAGRRAAAERGDQPGRARSRARPGERHAAGAADRRHRQAARFAGPAERDRIVGILNVPPLVVSLRPRAAAEESAATRRLARGDVRGGAARGAGRRASDPGDDDAARRPVGARRRPRARASSRWAGRWARPACIGFASGRDRRSWSRSACRTAPGRPSTRRSRRNRRACRGGCC